MTQLVTRIDPDLAASVDDLVEAGFVESRSDAVRRGLQILVDRYRRSRVGEQIADGYRRLPQPADDGAWPDEATRRMIAEEPW